jgi:hypothetical protein
MFAFFTKTGYLIIQRRLIVAPEILTMPLSIAQLFILLYDSEIDDTVMRLCAKIEIAAADESNSELIEQGLIETSIDCDDPDEFKVLTFWSKFLFDLGLLSISEVENLGGLPRGTLFKRISDAAAFKSEPIAPTQGT